jgi:sirohydrochlorin cobaltochelatase
MNKKALLVTSFGTSYANSREKTIGAVENALAGAFPEYDLKRAFTSQIVIKKIKEREGLLIDTVWQAMEKLCAKGYQEILVQPLHIIGGIEYETVLADLVSFKNKFSRLDIGCPLLGEPQDYISVVETLSHELSQCDPDEAVLFMGHGSSHTANHAYGRLEKVFKEQGLGRVYIATVEGSPTINAIISYLKSSGIRRVTLIPLMLVAGEHAIHDMAGDGEESWKTRLEKDGFGVRVKMRGLGEYEAIHQIYIKHAHVALEAEIK